MRSVIFVIFYLLIINVCRMVGKEGLELNHVINFSLFIIFVLLDLAEIGTKKGEKE